MSFKKIIAFGILGISLIIFCIFIILIAFGFELPMFDVFIELMDFLMRKISEVIQWIISILRSLGPVG